MRGAVLAAVLGLGVLGLGGGFGAGYSGQAFLFWDLAELNAALEAAGYPTLEGFLVLYGGMGVGGDVLRLGGGGFGGSRSVRAGGRQAELSLGMGGASFEIAVLEGGGFSATVGALLGGGSAELRLRSRAYSSLDDALAAPDDLHLTRGFFLFLPFVAAEFWPPRLARDPGDRGKPPHLPWPLEGGRGRAPRPAGKPGWALLLRPRRLRRQGGSGRLKAAGQQGDPSRLLQGQGPP